MVYEVLNEVTIDDSTGSVRQMNGNPFPYAWAIVNDLVRPPTQQSPNPHYDPTLDSQYDGEWEYYYVYQAFLYAQNAVNTYCNPGHGDVVPKLSLNAHFRVNEPLDSNQNPWAQGTLNLIENINDVASSDLIDSIGIQSHLEIRPYATPAIIRDAGGLRSILEGAAGISIEARITELDVGLIRTPLDPGDPSEYFTPTVAATYFPLQAEYYDSVVKQCLYNNSGAFVPLCEEITVWTLYDSVEGYKRCEYPGLYTPEFYHPDCLTEQPMNSPTPTPTLSPTATGVPPPTATPRPASYTVKSSHRSMYKKLQLAPVALTPPAAYPAPPLAPRPNPTENPYP